MLKSNPLCETEQDKTWRQIVISKIGNLKILNRTPIEIDKRAINERKTSEIDYLKRYAKQWYEIKESIQSALSADVKKSYEQKLKDFYQDHPRYLELVKSKIFWCFIV